MCGSRKRRRPRPLPPPPAPAPLPQAPPPPPPPAAPAPPPPPREVGNLATDEGGTTFKPGKKRKKDRSQAAKGTGSLRIPRTGVNTGAQGGGGVNV